MMHERRRSDMKTDTHRVALHGSTVHIGNLEVRLDAAAEYMRGIPADKWEAAFIHAVQVGMTEIVARRRRFHSDAQPPVSAPIVRRAEVGAPRAQAVIRAEQVVPQVEVVARVEQKAIQPTVTPPPDPRLETAASPPPESESWLRRLDEDLDVLDPVHALDPSSSER